MKSKLPENWRPCEPNLDSNLILNSWDHYCTNDYSGENLEWFSKPDYHRFGGSHEDLIKEDTQFMELLNGWKNDKKKTGKLPDNWKSFIVSN